MKQRSLIILVLAAAFWMPLSGLAFSTGTYRCASFNVAGAGGSCRLNPPIEILPGGTYRESTTTGTYRITNNKIVFSASSIRGQGTLAGSGQILFEYEYQGRTHTATYYCAQNCQEQDAQAGGPSGKAGKTQASGNIVWVDLKLQFVRAESVLGWASTAHLVPYETAREFLDPERKTPPTGSATGLARQEGRTAIMATTFKKARGGVRYVVFLDTGREHLPVALLNLANAPAEQTITLPAALLKEIPATGVQQNDTKYPPHISLGVRIMNVSVDIAQAIGKSDTDGAGVVAVLAGSRAGQAGIKEGDIIVEVDGHAIRAKEDVGNALSTHDAASPAKIKVFRDGQVHTITVR